MRLGAPGLYSIEDDDPTLMGCNASAHPPARAFNALSSCLLARNTFYFTSNTRSHIELYLPDSKTKTDLRSVVASRVRQVDDQAQLFLLLLYLLNEVPGREPLLWGKTLIKALRGRTFKSRR